MSGPGSGSGSGFKETADQRGRCGGFLKKKKKDKETVTHTHTHRGITTFNTITIFFLINI